MNQKKGAGLKVHKQTAKHRVKWEDLDSAFESRIRTGVIINLKHMDISTVLEDCKALFKRRILSALKKDGSLKVNAVFCGEFQIIKADVTLEENTFLNTRNFAIYRDTDLDNWFDTKIKQQLLTELDEFQERGSGWALKKC